MPTINKVFYYKLFGELVLQLHCNFLHKAAWILVRIKLKLWTKGQFWNKIKNKRKLKGNKKMKNLNITMREIEQYWGSLEAYNEEQRRCGLVELETAQLKDEDNLNHSWLTSATAVIVDNTINTTNTRGGLRFHFGHR